MHEFVNNYHFLLPYIIYIYNDRFTVKASKAFATRILYNWHERLN